MSSAGELLVTAALTGSLPGTAVLRGGARPGEVVAVCGVLGAAAAGLDLLESEIPHIDLDTLQRRLVGRQSCPRPPLWAGRVAAASVASSMMDISDGLGLGRDSGRMARASGVVLDISSASLHQLRVSMASTGISLDAAAGTLGVDPLTWMLTGGEDHGLLACFSQAADLPAGFHAVGVVSEPPAGKLESGFDGGAGDDDVLFDSVPLRVALESLRATGFDHFGG